MTTDKVKFDITSKPFVEDNEPTNEEEGAWQCGDGHMFRYEPPPTTPPWCGKEGCQAGDFRWIIKDEVTGRDWLPPEDELEGKVVSDEEVAGIQLAEDLGVLGKEVRIKLRKEEGTLKSLMRHLDDAWPEAMPPENIRVRFTVGMEAYVVGHIVLSAEEDGEIILVELKKEDV
jgi:hypothetical protein